jgi:phage shock protein C
MDKKLYRSDTNKMIAGVCGGIGDYFNIDPTIIRLVWVLLSIPMAVFGGVIAYILAAIIIPSR